MRWKLLVGLASFFAGCYASAADLQMQTEPAFVGFGLMTGTVPLAITLGNKGGDARGTLRVSCDGFQMDYPIELPHGSTKRLIAYPLVGYGGEVNLDLSTNQGDLHRIFRQLRANDPSSRSVLLIGDGQGDLGFIRPNPSESTSRLSDAYVKPEVAPDRAAAYADIAAIVLGPGAERLTDGAVRALHVYLAGGGAIAFLGGASSPVLGDKRWSDVLPVLPGKPMNVRRSALIDNLSKGDRIEGGFTILEAAPVPEASVRREGGNIILARRDIGLGRTLFFAFNFLEQPFTRWTGRRLLLEKFLRPIESVRAASYLASFSLGSPGDYDPGYGYGYGSPPIVTRAGMGYSSPQGDPFSTKLPPPTKVFWILASYFVVIIPINFLLLKKLKRGELAWVTAPLISVAFAGIFFAAASDLYSASLSTATQGLIVVANGGEDALFVGKSQFFFPRGGEYDLKMDGVDSLGATRDPDDYMYGYRGRRDTTSMQDVNPIDIGHILVSRMDVNNLAFRELAYRQLVPARKWLAVTLHGRRLSFANTGTATLTNIVAVVAGQSLPLDRSLAPGGTATLDLPEVVDPDPTDVTPPPGSYGSRQTGFVGLPGITADTKGIVVTAKILEPPVGPGIGATVKEREEVTLAFFTGLHYGQADL